MNTGQWPQNERPGQPLETVRTQFGNQQGTHPAAPVAQAQDPVEAVSTTSQPVNAPQPVPEVIPPQPVAAAVPQQPAAPVAPSQIDLTTLQAAIATLDDDRLLMVLVQLPAYQLVRALECLLKPVGDASIVPQDLPESDPADNRGADRAKVLRAGKIIYNNKMSVSDCSIRDLSDSGCRVVLESIAGIPDHFTLHILTGATRYECEVAWRKSNMMGLRFIG